MRAGRFGLILNTSLALFFFALGLVPPASGARPIKQNLSRPNAFVLDLKQAIELAKLSVKSIEVIESSDLEGVLTRHSVRVEALGLPEVALQVFDGVKAKYPYCNIASFRVKRATAASREFEVSALWHCFEKVAA